jgi:hypothetical protein
MAKRAGSEAGSFSQRCIYEDPDPLSDPYQNVTDSEHPHMPLQLSNHRGPALYSATKGLQKKLTNESMYARLCNKRRI